MDAAVWLEHPNLVNESFVAADKQERGGEGAICALSD